MTHKNHLSKRIEQIITILEYSNSIKLKIPTITLNSETLESSKFQHIKNALTKLEENKTLKVTVTEIDQIYSEIKIQINDTE